MKAKLLAIFCISVFFGLNVGAVELRHDNDYLLETGQYAEDYLYLGESLDFQGAAKDLFFAGERLDFSGKISAALHAAGETVNMQGTVGNGIKAVGRNIAVVGDVTGTSFIGGQHVEIDRTSRVDGDLFIGAREAVLQGEITGDLYVGAGEVSIQNEIHGDVKAYVGKIAIAENGRIVGNLTYRSDQELTEEELAKVTGEVKFERKDHRYFDTERAKSLFGKFTWLALLFKLSFLAVGLLLLLFPATRFLEHRYTLREVLGNALWGLIPIFVYPTAIVVSVVLLLTLPLAVSLLLLFVPLILVTKMLGVTIVGSYLAGVFKIGSNSRFLYFILGGVLYTVVSFIPLLGFLALAFVSSIGCGVLLSALIDKKLV